MIMNQRELLGMQWVDKKDLHIYLVCREMEMKK